MRYPGNLRDVSAQMIHARELMLAVIVAIHEEVDTYNENHPEGPVRYVQRIDDEYITQEREATK